MLIAKHHSGRGKSLLAVCDSELIGKCFEEGSLQLDLTSSFYAGDEMSEADFEAKIGQFDMINMVGERAVGIGIKCGLVKKVVKIKGIPHAEVSS